MRSVFANAKIIDLDSIFAEKYILITEISRDIFKAKELLSQGELVGIPTETVYGLAGNALNEDSLLKIYKTKNRPGFDPLIIHTDSFEKIKAYANEIPDMFEPLFNKFSPGPLTYVVEKKKSISDIATSGLKTMAVRVPNHDLTLDLLKILDFPIAAPSANLFGKISPTSPQHVYNQLNGKIPLILEGGNCNIGVESTIIRFNKDEIIVLRLGGTSIEELHDFLPNIKITYKSNHQIDAPGQLRSHYATKTPLLFGNIEENIQHKNPDKTGIISLSKLFPEINNSNQRQLSVINDLNEAAKNLFKVMHELDTLNLEIILAEEFPEKGLGKAINDRLKRASINW